MPGMVDAPRGSYSLRRFVPIVVLVAGLALFFALGLHRYFSADALKARNAGSRHYPPPPG